MGKAARLLIIQQKQIVLSISMVKVAGFFWGIQKQKLNPEPFLEIALSKNVI